MESPSCPTRATTFPSLYIPHSLHEPGIYLCSTYDSWLFTTLWTLIIYAAFYTGAAVYAGLMQVGSSRGSTASGDGGGTRSVTEKGESNAETADGLVGHAKWNWKITLGVGGAYAIVGGAEAVLAGSVVGAMLGTVYQAGEFRLSTWVPLVWAVINVLFLILSSFSIQERLL